MNFFIPALPFSALQIVGSRRDADPYKSARRAYHDEIAAVVEAMQEPFRRPAISIVAFIGDPHRDGDGRLRPHGARGLWKALDPVFEALVEMHALEKAGDAPLISVGVQSTAGAEGLDVLVREL